MLGIMGMVPLRGAKSGSATAELEGRAVVGGGAVTVWGWGAAGKVVWRISVEVWWVVGRSKWG